MVFKIKICGITNVADALSAADAGADAIGLNFYSGSKRCVDSETARQIVAAVGKRAEPVGVFVNHSADEIQRICSETGIRWVQLHGNEPPELIKSLGSGFSIVRVRRLDELGTDSIAADLQACCDIVGAAPAAVLVDSAAAGEFGGTGMTVDWQQLVDHANWLNATPLILAGGLTAENVAEAIRVVRPHAVDVASGVELAPGKKYTAKVRDFVAAARAAFQALETRF